MDEDRIEILLVEDNANDAMLALYALRDLIAVRKIQVVRDGEAALDYAFSKGGFAKRVGGNPQVILLDKNLPVVDGLEVLTRLRADPRTCLVPIVMMTGSAQESDITASYERGANSCLVKSIDFDTFTETARELAFYWLLVNQSPPDPSSPGMNDHDNASPPSDR